MIGKRSLGLLGALLALVLGGRAAAPTLHRVLILNPQLRDAIGNNDLPRVERLIRSGADVNLKWDSHGYLVATPLLLAVKQKNLGALQRLLKAGAHPRLADEYGRSALFWAVILEDVALARALLATGGDPNGQDANGTTPLMQAAQKDPSKDAFQMVQLLVASGADLHARDKNGDTALTYAAARGGESFYGNGQRQYRDTRMVRLLLEAGADLHATNEEGDSALTSAEVAGEPVIAAYLRSKGGRGLREELAGVPEAELFYAVRTHNLGEVKRLLRRGARIGVKDRDGQTPVIYAATQYDGVMIRYLLRHAQDVKSAVNVRDKDGHSALYHARVYDYSFKLLLEAGANLDPTNQEDQELAQFANPAQQAAIQAARDRRAATTGGALGKP